MTRNTLLGQQRLNVLGEVDHSIVGNCKRRKAQNEQQHDNESALGNICGHHGFLGDMPTLYRLIADFVVAVHFAFVAFVVFVGLLYLMLPVAAVMGMQAAARHDAAQPTLSIPAVWRDALTQSALRDALARPTP